MNPTPRTKLVLLALLVAFVTSCNPKPAGQEPVVPLNGVFVLPRSLTLLTGETSQLSAQRFQNGEAADVTSTATWTSGNTGVVTVSGTGLVTALAPGRTTLTGAVEGASSSVQVVVESPALQLLPLTMTLTYYEPPAPDPDAGPVDAGVARYDSDVFVANRLNADGTRTNIASSLLWGSSNPSVASVVPDSGVVTAVSEGECVITGFIDGETVTGRVVVTPE
ncbi:MAG: Ig-like domain-containing protein [Myxococcus sp.]|nr:Ig-like domain-containing protein [Myxococcus sp.]